MTTRKHPPIRRDWLSKTLAGFVCGGLIALGSSGLLVTGFAGMPLPTLGQLAMWLLAPVWLGVMSGVYFFASGLRAWLWLGGASALILGLMLALRTT
ncbi:conserved membrane protein of unknown function [Sterolibacterium denitrificans]|uniref:Iron uptake protein n=1 Tax=Sterolibacterium denitrificans TaxID=157592 RepID=A0A7Z7HRT4_9PROT|nr:hypothetical protein [Sterolibacterium denitrificans]SMB28141.1 conserved membrane protein of unknown function [Sterolibacterium denitrificans]